jgi:hypothetical protein
MDFTPWFQARSISLEIELVGWSAFQLAGTGAHFPAPALRYGFLGQKPC